MQALKQCELLVLCGTTKPYELEYVKDALGELDELNLSIMLSHAPKSVRKVILAALGGKNRRTYFAEYSPDLFDGKVNAKIFKEMVKEYM